MNYFKPILFSILALAFVACQKESDQAKARINKTSSTPAPRKARFAEKAVFIAAQASLRNIEACIEEAQLDGIKISDWSELGIKKALVPDYIKVFPICPAHGNWVFPAGSNPSEHKIKAKINDITFDSTTSINQYILNKP